MPSSRTEDSEAGEIRLLICGSVDDGKSTLIGRLMYDVGSIPLDQLEALDRDSRRHGTRGSELDLALLADGLEDERQQGITIDVAFRYFSTSRRAFVVADSPGHEQYTRNMATAASVSDVALIVVDARNGIMTQTRRHAAIASLFGIRHIVLAINKLDLVGWSFSVFEEMLASFRQLVEPLGFHSFTTIPISAALGDNVVRPSMNMPWFSGPTLLECLESIEVQSNLDERPFCMPVQLVLRPDADTRLYAGRISTGRVRIGDPILAVCTSRGSSVKELIVAGAHRSIATAGDAIAISLTDEIDVGRGDVLVHPQSRLEPADQFAAHLLWMDDKPLLVGRSYILKLGTRTVPAKILIVKSRLDIATLTPQSARTFGLNEIGIVNFATDTSVAFERFSENRDLGSFILMDRHTNATIAAGTIDFALRRGTNIHLQTLSATKVQRAEMKDQKPCIVWFTGLSGAGKSTISDRLEMKLLALGYHTYLLDGDNVRHGLNVDLGFTESDRVENIRRAGEVAKLFVDAGMIVLCSFISPFRAERRSVRALVEPDEFLEVFVDTPLEICEGRDPKGLYAKSRAGLIPNLTGIGSPYETPQHPDLVLKTPGASPDALADEVLRVLAERGRLRSR